MTYNLKRHAGGPSVGHEGRQGKTDGSLLDVDSELDSQTTIDTIVNSLQANGHTVHLVEATAELPHWFLTHTVDLVFNIAEGIHGMHRESQVPAILELLGVPFTGSNSITLALALDKAKTKQILTSENIPTPRWQLFPTPTTALNRQLEFPLIVKPNREGSSKGIWRESVVGDEPSLRRQVARIYERYHQEVLVEEFIDGLELTVGVLGHNPLPILEVDFSSCQASGEFFYSWRMKEFQGDAAMGLIPALHCPARLDGPTTERVHAVALHAHRALGCSDFSRTDIRLSADGVPYVLEVNPLPGLNPLDSNFPMMSRAAGLSHAALVQRIVELAMVRYHHTSPPAPAVGEGRTMVPLQESSSSSVSFDPSTRSSANLAGGSLLRAQSQAEINGLSKRSESKDGANTPSAQGGPAQGRRMLTVSPVAP